MRRTGNPIAALLVVLVLLAPLVVAADEISVSARVDRNIVSVSDPITYTITVEGTMRQVPQPTLPPLDGLFTVHTAGTSSNFSFSGGQIRSSKSWNFLLYPKGPGTITIGPAELEFAGTVYRTDPIEVEVVAGEGSARPRSMEERPSTGTESGGREVFIATAVDKKRAYIGEQITLVFKFYRRVNLWAQPRYSAPELTGFWSEDFPDREEYYETVDSYRYHVIEIGTALFGASPGEATVGPASLTYKEEGSPFTFFRSSGREMTLTTDPITLEILPLPSEGRPADFGGAVGSYRMRASLEPPSVQALEPVTLAIRITGQGNMRTVPPPPLPDLPEFKIYESGSSTDVTKQNRVVGGSKTFEYVLVPQTAGSRTVPGLSMSFFDPASGEYRRTGPGELPLEVAPAPEGTEEQALQPRTRISRLGRGIRYIREPAGTLSRAKAPVHTRPSFWILQLLPAVALVGAWVGRRRRDRFAADAGLARYARSGSKARGELKAARAELGAGDRAAVCAAITRAVTGFIGDRLNVQAQGMTAGELASALRSAGASDELIERVRRLLSECDLGRFAGGTDAVEAERLVEEAQQCLRGLERLPAKRRR